MSMWPRCVGTDRAECTGLRRNSYFVEKNVC